VAGPVHGGGILRGGGGEVKHSPAAAT
jgi:hypothetical protein